MDTKNNLKNINLIKVKKNFTVCTDCKGCGLIKQDTIICNICNGIKCINCRESGFS